MKDLGQKIKELRVKHRLSQSDLAKMCKISVQAVSKWENNLSNPNAENIIALVEIFGKDFIEGESNVFFPKGEGMASVKTIFKIGRGPSSSHTIGPEVACKKFRAMYPTAEKYSVTLYGSLAKMGRSHGTDKLVKQTLQIPTEVIFDYIAKREHPNAMDMSAYRNGQKIGSVKAFSIGGGNILFNGEKIPKAETVYKESSFSEVKAVCKARRIALWQYVKEQEGDDLWEYFDSVWTQMKATINKGLNDEGILPGGLEVAKKAKYLLEMEHVDESPETRQTRLISAYAFAVGEQNASFETVVTAPTCGAAGVLPAVLYYEQQKHDFSDEKIFRALATAAMIGNIIRTNASISGAECGCQAEIGSACAMAAGALAELFGLNIEKIEYAAEIALEHHLGLTCDPVCGLVQIPCIERNAVAAMRALHAVDLASLLWNTRKISFDSIVKTMKETGNDLSSEYRETSEGGMAKNYIKRG